MPSILLERTASLRMKILISRWGLGRLLASPASSANFRSASESIPTSDTTYRDHVAALPELMCELTPRIQYALEWAAYAHQHQSRYVMREGENGKMEKPHYIEHPYIVAAVVAQFTDDEDIIIAAILHDVVEDQPERMSFDIIEAEFGPRVRRIVRDVTKDNGMDNKELRT